MVWVSHALLTLSGPGGGDNIDPQTFGRLSGKNQKSQSLESFWLFLNMYILWLQRKKHLMWTITVLLRGVLNRPVKIFCANIHFYCVLFRFYHVRCLNMLQFGHRFRFWDRKNVWWTLFGVLFLIWILNIFDRPFYIARDRAQVNTRMIPNIWMRSTKDI